MKNNGNILLTLPTTETIILQKKNKTPFRLLQQAKETLKTSFILKKIDAYGSHPIEQHNNSKNYIMT